jgi:hypothetical protein
MYRRGLTLALAQIQFGQRQNGGIDMMAMADMMVVVVVNILIAMFGERMVMLGMLAGVQIMVVEMRPNRVRIAASMNMHGHRGRPGKLERNNQQKDQGDQAAHG